MKKSRGKANPAITAKVLKQELDKEIKAKKEEAKEAENRLLQRESSIDKRDEMLQKREANLDERDNNLLNKQKELQEKDAKMEEMLKEEIKQLENITPKLHWHLPMKNRSTI